MSLISRLKTWAFQEKLASSDLNAEFNNILNNLTQDKIESTATSVGNFQATSDPGELGSESLPASADVELKQHRLLIKEITGKTQWYQSPSRSLATLNLAKSELPAVGQQLSSSCSGFSTTGGTYVDVTNLSVSITVTGRPVFIGLVADGISTSNLVKIEDSGSASAIQGIIKFMRDATDLTEQSIKLATNTSGTTLEAHYPLSAFSHFEVPAAGTYTYKVQALVVGGATQLSISNAKLLVYEM